MSNFFIRKAEAADHLMLVNMLDEIQSEPSFNAAQFSWTKESFLEELKFSTTWVLFDEAKQPTSFLCFRQNSSDYEIMLLATRPQFRRRGLQSQILQALLRQAAAQKAVIRLEVHSENSSAIELYKKNNFIFAGQRRRYYRDGADAVLMIWPESAAV